MVLEQKKKRFEKLLKINISDIICRKIKDPRIGFVTITRIALSNDLRNAKVYVSILGTEEEQEKSMKGLYSATNFVRTELAYILKNCRFIPAISFIYDRELEKIHQVMIKAAELAREDRDREI